MKYVRNFSLVFVMMFAVYSCKHQEKTAQGKEPSPFTDFHVQGGENVMTAGKATEEETFVQGCIEKSQGNYRKALVKFQECLEMNPKSAAANYEMAGIYQLVSQPDLALSFAKNATTINPQNPWYKLRYAELLQENNLHEDAMKIFRELSDSQPQNVDFLFRYAASQKKAGKEDDALKTYDKIETVEGVSDTLASCRIAIYKSKGDLIGQEQTIKSLAVAFPEDIRYQELLGDFYSTTNQVSKAEEVYRSMGTKFPFLALPHLKLATIYKQQQLQDKAFKEAVLGFEDQNFLEEKITYLKNWYPNADTSAALSSEKRKDVDSLCRILRRVHLDQAGSWEISADYLFKDGKIKEARDYYHKAGEVGQGEYASWKRLMELNDQLKDVSAQEKDCKEALELFPTQSDPYYYLGKIQFNKKEYKKSIDNLESSRDYLIDNPQKDLEIKLILIDAYRSTGKNEKADSYSEEIISKDSSNLPLIATYCASLSERKAKLYNAEQLMLMVVQKEPGNPTYLETLSWIEYQMREYKVAHQYMSLALLKSPDNARMNERMGDIQFHLNKPEEALNFWKIAKEKGGTNTALEKKISTKTLVETE